MIFSEKVKLAKRVDEYIEKRNISKTTFGAVCVLDIKGLLVDEQLVELVTHITENIYYETDINGRIEEYCFYCDQNKKKGHYEGCLHLKAIKILKLIMKDKEK